jgi:hypothetical protein
MSNALLIANIELWRLLPVAGIWKCRRMVAPPAVTGACLRRPLPSQRADVFIYLLGSCRILAAELLATGVNVIAVSTRPPSSRWRVAFNDHPKSRI